MVSVIFVDVHCHTHKNCGSFLISIFPGSRIYFHFGFDKKKEVQYSLKQEAGDELLVGLFYMNVILLVSWEVFYV